MTKVWDSPHDWLEDQIQACAADHNVAELLRIVDALMWRLDKESIQDLFQLEENETGGTIEKRG